jgi:hypothetical protein
MAKTTRQRITSDDEILLVQRKNHLVYQRALPSIEKDTIVTAKTWRTAGSIALPTNEAIGGMEADPMSAQED